MYRKKKTSKKQSSPLERKFGLLTLDGGTSTKSPFSKKLSPDATPKGEKYDFQQKPKEKCMTSRPIKAVAMSVSALPTSSRLRRTESTPSGHRLTTNREAVKGLCKKKNVRLSDYKMASINMKSRQAEDFRVASM